MRRLLLAAVLLSTLTISAQTQAPRFEDYLESAVYKGKNAPAIITSDWRMFRTRLRWAAKNQKVNFAGHYIFTSWGCGAGCIMFALIDARTGRIYSPGFSVCCWPYDRQTPPVEFRLDSRLMIIHGLRNEEGSEGPHYYVLKKNELRLIAP